MYTLRLDADDLLLEPLEPVAGVPEEVLPGAGPWPSLREALEVALTGVEASAAVLTFEPSRADLREALLALGRRYVDGGRLVDGRPDPAAARRALEGGAAGAVLLQPGDRLPCPPRVPVLIDARGCPWVPDSPVRLPPGTRALMAPGPRDGLRRALGYWLIGDTAAGCRAPADAPALGLGFGRRAHLRAGNQARALSTLAAAARSAALEARERAGFLWVARPGRSGERLREELARRGLVGFASAHHAYRHQLRVTPPPRSVLSLAARSLAGIR